MSKPTACTVEERQARLSVIGTDLSGTEETLDELLQRQAEAKSRKDVLKQLIESKEGFSAGAQTVLTQFDSAIGSLADQIRVPDEHVRAVEAALGANLQLVITEQPQSADQMLQRLAQGEQGRASIVALELCVNAAGRFRHPTSRKEPCRLWTSLKSMIPFNRSCKHFWAEP